MNGKKQNLINTIDISTYRQTLMGIGIIGVLTSHWFGFQSIKTGEMYLLSTLIVKLVFTEGFLFLSGFGLYYSFSKQPNRNRFYQKRIYRLYVPFLLLSFPLYLCFLYTRDGYSFFDFITQLTTMYFWINGNYGGMWYIALSLLLYFLFPIIYDFLFLSNLRGNIFKLVSLLFVLFFLIYTIKRFDIIYYEKISIGIDKIIFFILGIFWGYEVKTVKLATKKYFILFLSIFLIYIFLTIIRILLPNLKSDIVMTMCAISQKLCFMPMVCMCFNKFKEQYIIKKIYLLLNWFGKYSLELYILHMHFFEFFQFGYLYNVPLPYQATTAILFALVLCVPVNRFMAVIVKNRIG